MTKAELIAAVRGAKDDGTYAALREKIVLAGKRHPNMLTIARCKGLTDDPKYFDPNDMVNTGAIFLDDMLALAAVVKAVDAHEVLEIGTWFGTSAAAMVMATGNTCVHTCDRNDVYVADAYAKPILFYHGKSTDFLRDFMEAEFYTDMVFIDARLKRADPGLLAQVTGRQVPILLHDFEGDAKGVQNYKMLRPYFRKWELIKPNELMDGEGRTLAAMVPREWR